MKGPLLAVLSGVAVLAAAEEADRLSGSEIVAVITAVGSVLSGLLTIWLVNRVKTVADRADVTAKKVEVTETLTKVGDGKLDAIGTQLDGQRTETLDRIASLEKMLAEISGNTIRAEASERAAADHRVASAVAAASVEAAKVSNPKPVEPER